MDSQVSYDDLKKRFEEERKENIKDCDYFEVLKNICSYVYVKNNMDYEYIDSFGNEEINRFQIALLYETFFSCKEYGKCNVTSDIFAEDYVAYWNFWQRVGSDPNLDREKRLLENSDGPLKVMVDRMWNNDYSPYPYDIVKEREEPDLKTEKSNMFFFKQRSREFFQHVVAGKTISRDAEMLYMNLFSIYLNVENEYSDEKFLNLRKWLSQFRKKNDDNLAIIKPINWSFYVCREIGYTYHFDREMEKLKVPIRFPSDVGIIEFLNNFSMKKRLVKKLFYYEIDNRLLDQDCVPLLGSYLVDFMTRYFSVLKERGVPILGDYKKDGMASCDQRTVNRILKANLGKYLYDDLDASCFVLFDDTDSLKNQDRTFTDEEKETLCRAYYNRYLVAMFAQVHNKEDSVLGVAELANTHDFISTMLERLYDVVLLHEEKKQSKAEKKKRFEEVIVPVYDELMRGMDYLVDHINREEKRTKMYTEQIKQLYKLYLEEYHTELSLNQAIRDAMFQVIRL